MRESSRLRRRTTGVGISKDTVSGKDHLLVNGVCMARLLIGNLRCSAKASIQRAQHSSSSINHPEATKMSTASKSPAVSIVQDGMRLSPHQSPFRLLRLWVV